MAKEILNDGESGLSIRTKLNQMFTQLYAFLSTDGTLVDNLPFDITKDDTPLEGEIQYNSTEGTFSGGVAGGSILQFGEELFWGVRNNSGATITNGTAVYASGVLGASGRITIAPMLADGSIDAKFFLGIATQDIPNATNGKICSYGKVKGLNTSAFAENDFLWVSQTVPGQLTATAPTSGIKLDIGKVINSSTNNGTIAIRTEVGDYIESLHNVDTTNMKDNGILYKEGNEWKSKIFCAKLESGYYKRSDTIMNFDELTRTFTIAPIGSSFTISTNRDDLVVTTPQSVVISDVDKEHFVYFDETGSLVETTTFDPAIIYDNVYTTSLYWNVAHQELVNFGEERHGNIMDAETHTHNHLTRGTQFVSGLGVTTPTSSTLSTSAGIIRDEDIQINIASQTTFFKFWKEGATGVWRKSTTATVNPYLQLTNLQWNEFTGTTWQLTEALTPAKYINQIVFATNDIRTGHQVIVITGESSYDTIAEARDGVGTELSSLNTSGLAFQEFVPMAVLTIRADGTIQEVTDIRKVTGLASGTFSDHEALGNLLGGDANGHYHLTDVELEKLRNDTGNALAYAIALG